MAIIVEEGGKRTSFVGILIWLIVVGVIGSASYYIFFKQPEIVDIVVSSDLEDAAELSKIKLNRATIDSDPVFLSLEPYITPPTDADVGRLNPFAPF